MKTVITDEEATLKEIIETYWNVNGIIYTILCG